jgi:hypothetical protein
VARWLRCYASRWRKFWTSGAALRGGGLKPLTGALAEDRGAERREKRRDLITSGADREDERRAETGSLPSEASKRIQMTSKPGSRLHPGMSLGVTRLLPRWCPAYRQHEPGPGSRVEPVKVCPDTAVSLAGGKRETSKRRIRKELSTGAGHAGGLARSSCEVPAYRSRGGAKGRGRPG